MGNCQSRVVCEGYLAPMGPTRAPRGHHQAALPLPSPFPLPLPFPLPFPLPSKKAGGEEFQAFGGYGGGASLGISPSSSFAQLGWGGILWKASGRKRRGKLGGKLQRQLRRELAWRGLWRWRSRRGGPSRGASLNPGISTSSPSVLIPINVPGFLHFGLLGLGLWLIGLRLEFHFFFLGGFVSNLIDFGLVDTGLGI